MNAVVQPRKHRLASQRLIAWLEQNLPSLERVASLQFVQSSHEQFFTGIGWQVVREPWYPDTCFEISFPDIQRRLVALYDDGQQEIGIGLYALANPHESHEYILASATAYDDAFHRLLGVMRHRLSPKPTIGAYRFADHEIEYSFATWDYEPASLVLVQHHEGDGHLGHEASLDIRLRPRSASMQFPLVTNMLF